MKDEKDDEKKKTATGGKFRKSAALWVDQWLEVVSREMRPYLILPADKRTARLRPVLRQEPQKPHSAPPPTVVIRGFSWQSSGTGCRPFAAGKYNRIV